MSRIFMPLPDNGFDPTEVAVPWKLLTRAGHEVVFATEAGATPAADPLLLGPGPLPRFLRARPEPVAWYRELEASPAFVQPTRWSEVEPSSMDALFLAGGHAPPMRQYLGSEELARWVASFWALARPVAAICHGVVVLARAQGAGGRSVLHGRRTTCLPHRMERGAYFLTAWRLGRYYRTYDAYVEDEVRAALARPEDLERGPGGLRRGTDDDDGPAFVVEDGAYLSARWPGDAYLIGRRLAVALACASA
jgi:putative intracellular protease/amidase